MKRICLLGALAGLLMNSCNLTLACDQFDRNNPRSFDKEIARQTLTQLLLHVITDPSNVYETPRGAETGLPFITTVRNDIPNEFYKVVNYAEHQETSPSSSPRCWWLFIPLSIEEHYNSLIQTLRNIVINSATHKKTSPNGDIKAPELAPTDSIYEILKPYLSDWMYQDSFERNVIYKGEEIIPVILFSLLHEKGKKLLFIGHSSKNPSWIKYSKSIHDNNSYNFYDDDSDDELDFTNSPRQFEEKIDLLKDEPSSTYTTSTDLVNKYEVSKVSRKFKSDDQGNKQLNNPSEMER